MTGHLLRVFASRILRLYTGPVWRDKLMIGGLAILSSGFGWKPRIGLILVSTFTVLSAMLLVTVVLVSR